MTEKKQTYTIAVTTNNDGFYDMKGATAYLVDDRGDLIIRRPGRTQVFAQGYWLTYTVVDGEPNQA